MNRAAPWLAAAALAAARPPRVAAAAGAPFAPSPPAARSPRTTAPAPAAAAAPAPPTTPAPRARPAAGPPPAPDAGASDARVAEVAMLDETDALGRALGEARHVAPPTGFQRRLVDAAEARAAAEAVVRGAHAAAERAVEGKMLERLGLLPPGADYGALVAGAVARRPAGFYDPEARRLYVPDWIDLHAQRPALAHELAHALQDQRFGLRQFLRIEPRDPALTFDARLAREALIEGDASVLAMEALDPRGTFPPPREIAALVDRMRAGAGAGVPSSTPPTPSTAPFLRAVLAFPYIEGFAFVARARGVATWASIDAIWAQPPESTAQILHPEAYDRHDGPAAIGDAPLAALAPVFKVARADTLGEVVMRAWLAGAAPSEIAARAAAGWRGDRVVVYLPAAGDARDLRAVLAWLTVWDSGADAADFEDAAVARLAVLAAGAGDIPDAAAAPPEPPAAGRAAVLEEPRTGAAFAAQRRGTRVALLVGAPAAAVAPSLAVMLEAWPVRLPPAAPPQPAVRPPAPPPRPAARRGPAPATPRSPR
jgi:hypothetical protein